MKSIIERALAAMRGIQFKAMVAVVGLLLVASNIYLLAKDRTVPTLLRSESLVADESSAQAADDLQMFKEVPVPESADNPSTYNLVHGNCLNKLRFETQPSSVFKSSPYDGSFIVGSNSTSPGALHGLYDINGDSLPDYVYYRSFTLEGTQYIDGYYEACVYLHNGTGWSKAYSCLAETHIDKETGAVHDGKYYGDCGQF